uniref:Self-incompatibility ribonuclease n=1 Tax=Petunia axillaris subsp. axillaris TaxID=55889 RepID=Q8GS10_PETAX|nr:self-incompatibility ribonuclease [Petunia axillaris subsp. axillaris]AAN76455.1 self-incompatibility ribonuclease [Petunia axillaris subsp. axillaris]
MFKSQLTSAHFILLFAISPIYGDFDYMQLVLTWPATFCYPKGFCQRIPPKNFTIHGLWPDKERQRLQFCAKDYKYVNFEGDIKSSLDHHWIQLRFNKEVGLKYQPLWHDQYKKHGTCCSNLYDQTAYFLLAMRLKNKFDLLGTLRTNGITPGRRYTFQRIHGAIKTVTQMDPDLKCVEHIKGVLELNEIGICFTPNAESPYHCPQSHSCEKRGYTGILFR